MRGPSRERDPRLDETIADYRQLLDQDQLAIVEEAGGIRSLEWLADSVHLNPDQRGDVARLVDDIRKHQHGLPRAERGPTGT